MWCLALLSAIVDGMRGGRKSSGGPELSMCAESEEEEDGERGRGF